MVGVFGMLMNLVVMLQQLDVGVFNMYLILVVVEMVELFYLMKYVFFCFYMEQFCVGVVYFYVNGGFEMFCVVQIVNEVGELMMLGVEQ